MYVAILKIKSTHSSDSKSCLGNEKHTIEEWRRRDRECRLVFPCLTILKDEVWSMEENKLSLELSANLGTQYYIEIYTYC